MQLSNELWYTVFSFLTQKSQSKFSCLLNLYNLSAKEILLIWISNDLWVDTARNGYIKLMKLLIKAGTDLNIQYNYGRTILYLSTMFGDKEIVELLIKAGNIDLNIRDDFGYTALHNASLHGDKEIVELLIKAGADLNIKNKYNRTALNLASLNGHKEIVKLLKN